MLLSFLRLFRPFRGLENENQMLREAHAQLTAEKLLLQDRLDAAREDRERLWSTLQEALREERTAYQAHINQAWQKMGAGVPYPDAPHLPPSATPQPSNGEPLGRRTRLLPSEAVAQVADAWAHKQAVRR